MAREATSGDRLMQAYLLFVAIALVPIALSYGIDPAGILPKLLDIKVEGTDHTQIFRALMCLYLGSSVFWAIAAFAPAWRQGAVVWAIVFCFSLAIGRVISLMIDGPASPLLNVYLALEIFGGLLGLAVLAKARKSAARR